MTRLNGWKIRCALFSLFTVWALIAHAQTFNTVLSFDGADGANPIYSGLTQGTDGTVYGTTTVGGTNGGGTIFRVTGGGDVTTLYNFCSDTGCVDGANPWGQVTLDADGNTYGTTYGGGMNGVGTVFKLARAGGLTTLHSFNTSDGAYPESGLIEDLDGNFYGTTTFGGHGYGTVFKITKEGILTTLYKFCSQTGCLDGNGPVAALALGTDGNFYGTTYQGGGNPCQGLSGCGTVFRVSSQGHLTTLHIFDSADGTGPAGAMIQASDGNFYGTTIYGGTPEPACTAGCGTIFKMTPQGMLSTLDSFDNTDGAIPTAGVVQGTDGNFYGTTIFGGENSSGTVFMVTSGGTLTTLFTFGPGSSAPEPLGALLQATNGTFYGTTYEGGLTNDGTVFSIATGLGAFVRTSSTFGKVRQTGGIIGQGFTGTTSVMLNGVPANFTVVSDTFIKATVPDGATTGYVTVITPSGTLTSNVPFHVLK